MTFLLLPCGHTVTQLWLTNRNTSHVTSAAVLSSELSKVLQSRNFQYNATAVL